MLKQEITDLMFFNDVPILCVRYSCVLHFHMAIKSFMLPLKHRTLKPSEILGLASNYLRSIYILINLNKRASRV